MKRLVILATKYEKNKEADELFNKRGWKRVWDNSKPLGKPRLVRKDKFSTSLIDLLILEVEYGE